MKKNNKILMNVFFLFSVVGLSTATVGFLKNDNAFYNLSNNNLKAVSADDMSLNINNRNNNNETPYGIVNISGTKVRLISFFNTVVWEYDLNSNNSIIKQITNSVPSSVANNFFVKYNPFTDHIIVYGKVTVSSSTSPFIFQLNLQTGLPYYAKSNSTLGILSSSTLGNMEIFDFYINKNNGVIFPIPKNGFNNNGNSDIKLVNSISYDVVQTKFTGLTTASFTYEASKSIQAIFDISNDVWGFTLFTKNTGTTKDKIQYFLFDGSLNFVIKSSEIEVNSTNGSATTSSHSEHSVATPVVIPYIEQNKQMYLLMDSSVVPIGDSNYTNSFIYGTESFWTFKFYYDKTGNSHTFTQGNSTSNIMMNGSPYSILSFDLDKKNNVLYYISYGTTSSTPKTIDWAKYIIGSFKIENATISSMHTALTITTDANVKTIPSFSLINDANIKNNNGWFVLQEATYTANFSSTLNISTTNPEKINFKRGNGVPGTSGLGTLTASNSWNRVIENSYSTAADSSNYKSKLPQDVPESEILNWVSYSFSNTTNSFDYSITKSLENMTALSGYTLSGSNNVLFNNSTGALKARVKVDFDEWWNTGSKYTRYIDIDLNIFNTVEKLKFILVTNNTVDSTKYQAIETLKQTKKPSEVTTQEILDNFFVVGANSSLNLTTNSISINGTGSNTTPNYNYPIKVTTDDVGGVLSLTYDLSSLSSLSMESTNVRGRYDFTNFVKEITTTQITLNVTKFNEIKKNKLPYEFDLDDIVSSLNVPSIYNNYANWELTYNDTPYTEAYYNNLMTGTTSFTIKYRKDNTIPSTIPDTDLIVTVDSNSNGTGCKKISDITGNSITFDENVALSLTGDMSLNDVNDNLGTLLRKTIGIKNNWFSSSEINLTLNNDKTTNNVATYNLSFNNNQINSNIKLFNTVDNTYYHLLVKQEFIEKLKTNQETSNLFSLTEVSFKYSLVKYNWNYGITQTNTIPQMNYETMLNSINEERQANNKNKIEYEFLLPSQFISKYKNNWQEFNELYPLISPIKNSTSLNSTNTNPEYFEIDEIVFIGNDSLGTVNVRYTLLYKNLGSSGLKSNAEIILTNFKTLESNSNNYLTLVIILSVILALIVIITPIILTFRRNKYLHAKKNNSNNNGELLKKLNKINKNVVPVKTTNQIYNKKIVDKLANPNVASNKENNKNLLEQNKLSIPKTNNVNKPIIVSNPNVIRTRGNKNINNSNDKKK
ncbi:hypothetical protein [Malacoplasma muris]|uniref:hypothetical protein n=1 Tax=Malacoplasma muris TaxID=2119 RepID=UPI00398E31B0